MKATLSEIEKNPKGTNSEGKEAEVEINDWALTSVAQWIECGPANLRYACLIPSIDTCLGCRPGPQCGMHER